MAIQRLDACRGGRKILGPHKLLPESSTPGLIGGRREEKPRDAIEEVGKLPLMGLHGCLFSSVL